MLLILLALWILFNGRLTLEVFLIGLALSAAVTWFCRKYLDYPSAKGRKGYRLVPDVLGYLWLLLCEIVKSNLAMLPYLYGKKREIKPKLISFTTPVKNQFGRNILSNSITLTPGTITVLQEGQRLTVHCLDEDMAQGVEELAFQQKLVAMENKAQALEGEAEK